MKIIVSMAPTITELQGHLCFSAKKNIGVIREDNTITNWDYRLLQVMIASHHCMGWWKKWNRCKILIQHEFILFTYDIKCWCDKNERRQFNKNRNLGITWMNTGATCTHFNIPHINYHATFKSVFGGLFLFLGNSVVINISFSVVRSSCCEIKTFG